MESLVFVHGFMGGGAQWNSQIELFSEHYNVAAPDLTGFGRDHLSVAPDRIEDYAKNILDELSRQGVDRFHLVGHSMGGMVVQEMITQAPDRVDTLILYGTGPIGLLPGRFETIDESKRRAIKDGPELTSDRIVATWFMDGRKADGFEICEALGKHVSLQAVLAGLSAMEMWSGEANLTKIKSRSLVIWGDGDRTYPWSQPEALWTGIENANLAVVPGCAHMVHLEKSDIFNSLLLDFLGKG